MLKRVYASWQETDGFRILVDRLWPRGIKKENAHIDLWLKEIAPSTELRQWFGHEIEKWESFERKYLTEINQNKEATEKLLEAIKENREVTLLFGAKDEQHNQAVVLQYWLKINSQ